MSKNRALIAKKVKYAIRVDAIITTKNSDT